MGGASDTHENNVEKDTCVEDAGIFFVAVYSIISS